MQTCTHMVEPCARPEFQGLFLSFPGHIQRTNSTSKSFWTERHAGLSDDGVVQRRYQLVDLRLVPRAGLRGLRGLRGRRPWPSSRADPRSDGKRRGSQTAVAKQDVSQWPIDKYVGNKCRTFMDTCMSCYLVSFITTSANSCAASHYRE